VGSCLFSWTASKANKCQTDERLPCSALGTSWSYCMPARLLTSELQLRGSNLGLVCHDQRWCLCSECWVGRANVRSGRLACSKGLQVTNKHGFTLITFVLVA
jgi:hypothetical protein